MAFFDQLGQKLTQTSQDAVKKTKDMAEAVRLNSAVADEGKKIEAAYREIGRLYYERFADACDPALQAPVEEVRPDLSPVNLNTADEAALTALPGIGVALAARIVEYREEHGPFQTVDELVQVPGIGPGILEGLREYAVTGGE